MSLAEKMGYLRGLADGLNLDEGVRIAQAVEPYVDLIHVSAGSYQL